MTNKFKGVKADDIANMSISELNSLSKSDLSKAVSRLASVANKRLNLFIKKDIETPATISAEKSGGRFSTKGKNLNQLRSEFIRAKKFLSLKTSTARGYKKFRNDFFNRVKAKSNIRLNITDDQLSRFWRIYDKTANLAPFYKGSEPRQKMVFDMFIDMENKSDEEILTEIQNNFNSYYEEQQAIENEFDTSKFFTIFNNKK